MAGMVASSTRTRTVRTNTYGEDSRNVKGWSSSPRLFSAEKSLRGADNASACIPPSWVGWAGAIGLVGVVVFMAMLEERYPA